MLIVVSLHLTLFSWRRGGSSRSRRRCSRSGGRTGDICEEKEEKGQKETH